MVYAETSLGNSPYKKKLEDLDQAYLHLKELTGYDSNESSDEDDQTLPGPSSPQVKQNKRWTILYCILEITQPNSTCHTFGSIGTYMVY